VLWRRIAPAGQTYGVTKVCGYIASVTHTPVRPKGGARQIYFSPFGGIYGIAKYIAAPRGLLLYKLYTNIFLESGTCIGRLCLYGLPIYMVEISAR